jgi:hypothetical protein
MTEYQKPPILWYSIWQFVLTTLTVLILWGFALFLVFLALAQTVRGAGASGGNLSLWLMAWAMAFSGVLLLPSAFYALLRLSGRPVKQSPQLPGILKSSVFVIILLLILYLGVVLLGYWVSQVPSLAWWLLPPLHILAISLPVLGVAYLGTHHLPPGRPQRMWGVFGSGLVLGPALILVAETAALVVAVIVAIVWAASQPDLMKAILAASQEIQSGRPSSDELLRSLGPYMLQPALLFGVFIFGALIVPLIEELIKPIGVWLLFGRPMTPAAGLAAGAISGAGYALFESLALTSNGQDWAASVVARSGTAVIHIFTASLMGWALVLAWRERRYLRLLGTYLLAVLIHGSWNALALLNAVTSLAGAQAGPQKYPLLSQAGAVAPFGLIIMTISALIALLWANRRLRPVPVGPSIPEQPANSNLLE